MPLERFKEGEVEIAIDTDKCKYSMYDPLGCKKCQEVCPYAIIGSRPIKERDFNCPECGTLGLPYDPDQRAYVCKNCGYKLPPEERYDPTIWKLVITFPGYCNGCAACVNVCPTNAISVMINGEAVLRTGASK